MSVPDLTVPGQGRGLIDVFGRRFLLRLLVKKELRVRYRGSLLGMVWSYVKPATQFVVFYIALGVFLALNKGMEDYAVYLFSGIVVINFFSEGFSNGTRSITSNAPLVKKIYLPRELFPVASMWVSAVHFFPQLVVLLVGALFAGWHPSVLGLLAAVVGFLTVSAFALGLGMLFAAVNVLFRDAENLVDLLVMVFTWTSPIMYAWPKVAAVLPTWAFTVYQINPITSAVELFHAAFWYPGTSGSTPLPPHLPMFGFLGLVIAGLFLMLGQAVFHRVEGRFAQEL